MRAHVAEKVRVNCRTALEENALHLEHKRNVKRFEKETDVAHMSDVFRHGTENRLIQAEIVKITAGRDKESAAQRQESAMYLAQARLNQRLQDRHKEDSDRGHELRIEQASQVQELAKIRDELLHRVALAQKAHGGAPKPIPLASRRPSRSVSPLAARSAQRASTSVQKLH